MPAEVPVFPGLQAVSDTSPAQWLVDRLWSPQGGVPQVGNVIPDVYPSYGRLLHPARSTEPDGPDQIRWSTISAERGVPIHSTVRFRELVGWRDGPDPFNEDCLLFTGPLTAATNFRSGDWFQSPTVWWPGDRAWYVSTPVGGFSTYIGGSEPCLNALYRDPRLEVLPIEIGQPVDPSPYPA